MGIFSFGHMTEEQCFESYNADGFVWAVRSLGEFVGKNSSWQLAVHVAVDQEDFHDIQWHAVPGVMVSTAQSDEQISAKWSQVHAYMRQLHKPKLTVV